MPPSSRSSPLFDARGAGKPQTSGPSERSLEGSARSLGHLVNGHDHEQRGLGVGLDDHNPRALPASGLDHESALHDAGFEPGGSLQHSADLHLGHAALLHAQFGVAGERKVPIPLLRKGRHPAFGGPIVAPGHTSKVPVRFRSPRQAERRVTADQSALQGGTPGGTPRAREVFPLQWAASRISPGQLAPTRAR